MSQNIIGPETLNFCLPQKRGISKMPYFDNSIKNSPEHTLLETTYNSYMCQSQEEYPSQDCDKIKGIVKGNNIWFSPYAKQSEYKSSQSHIFNFRNILSETISKITKDNPLKKGESVELTVEIELMKSPKNTPTNSLVEVTIIQHNKIGDGNGDNNDINKPIIAKRMQLQLNRDNKSTCEFDILKHKNPLKRVITTEGSVIYLKTENNKFTTHSSHLQKKDALTQYQERNFKQRKKNSNLRSKFIKILPDDKNHCESNKSRNKKTSIYLKKVSEATDNNKKQAIKETVTKNSSLMKKISNVFLPSKKADKNEMVKTALSALKNEINHLKVSTGNDGINRSNKKIRKQPIHNLGKLVNNILYEVLQSSDDSIKNKIKNNSMPLSYQSFFEPIARKNKRNKKKIAKINENKKKLYRSHSDTCCIKPLSNNSGSKLKTCNSISDCKPYTNKQPQTGYDGGDIKQIMSKIRHRSSYKNHKEHDDKNPDSYGKGISKHKVKSRTQRHFKRKNLLNPKSSFINWNGKFIKVNKNIKERIEMMIVNELENLAIKDGMECEVTPLPSMGNMSKGLNFVEKISSFICELDISDKSIKNIMKKQKSLHKKVNVYQSANENCYNSTYCEIENKSEITSNETQTMTSSVKYSETFNKSNTSSENVTMINSGNKNQKITRNGSCIFSDTNEIDENYVQVKYMNTNLNNWSNESQTVILDSPEMCILKQINVYQKNLQPPKTAKDDHHFQNLVNSGFVKVIKSDDSTWNKHFSGINTENSSQPFSNKFLTLSASTSTAFKLSSESTESYDSTIKIELDIKDLEFIIKEARQCNNVDKILIEAKKLNEKASQKPLRNKFSGKNSPSYTNQLLINAAKKLEKYAKRDEKNVEMKTRKSKG